MAAGLPALAEAGNGVGEGAAVGSVLLGRDRSSSCSQLAASPHLARLVGLDLTEASIGDDGAAALAAAPWVGNLRQLGARGLLSGLMGARFTQGPWQIGDGGAKALASSPNLGRLELLELRGSAVGPAAAEMLRQRFGRGVLL
jgi:hypothetical protein